MWKSDLTVSRNPLEKAKYTKKLKVELAIVAVKLTLARTWDILGQFSATTSPIASKIQSAMVGS